MRSAWLVFRLGSGATPMVSRCCHGKINFGQSHVRTRMEIENEYYKWDRENCQEALNV